MKYGCVRTDNMSGTVHGKDLVSLKFDKEIENGNIVEVGALLEDEREVREAKVPTASTELRNLAVIASEEVVKDKAYNNLAEFINEAGDILRGYRLVSRDIFSVTAEALDGEAKVGSVVEAQANTKMKVVDAATSGSTQIGTIIAVEDDWYVIEVL